MIASHEEAVSFEVDGDRPCCRNVLVRLEIKKDCHQTEKPQ
jgi:hypothetical protein